VREILFCLSFVFRGMVRVAWPSEQRQSVLAAMQTSPKKNPLMNYKRTKPRFTVCVKVILTKEFVLMSYAGFKQR